MVDTVFWITHPVQLPGSAPEALRHASLGWAKVESNVVAISEDRIEAESRTFDTQASEAQPRKRKRSIRTGMHQIAANDKAASFPANQYVSPTQPDESLAAALQRMYPAKERYHVKISHTIRPDQWQPVDTTTQDYDPSMRQPLNRTINWDDHGITRQTDGKVPHETVLDFLVDVMRNKHWRGDVTTTNLHSHKLTWPRLHFYQLTKAIAENPFLLRLAQMLEGRFTAAASGKLDYVPAVHVQGSTNQAVRIEARYIAGILIHALGQTNTSPCSLCASTWNTSEAAAGETRPFSTCKSLSVAGLPERFRACSNHFWFASVTDCDCVDMTAPLHSDEPYEYFYTCFASNASNYIHVRETLRFSSLDDEGLAGRV